MTGPHLLPMRANDDAIDLLAARLGRRVGTEVLDDLSRRARMARAPGRAVDRSWTFDRRDRWTLRWWPQGVSSLLHEGRRLVAISWYAKKLPWDRAAQGSRVTFLDLDSLRYRHVLLVEAGPDGSVAPLRVHAGGIVWHDGLLLVAATGKGFHACRVDDVLRVDGSGAASTFGYRYVLPTWRRYRTRPGGEDGDRALRFSFIDRDEATGRLLLGEYASGDGPRRLAQVVTDPGSPLPAVDVEGRADVLDVADGVRSMQGVTLAHGVHHVTTSHGRFTRGSVWTGRPGALRRHRAATPMGPEDLTYTAETDELWTVSEHPGARWLVTMRRAWFESASP